MNTRDVLEDARPLEPLLAASGRTRVARVARLE